MTGVSEMEKVFIEISLQEKSLQLLHDKTHPEYISRIVEMKAMQHHRRKLAAEELVLLEESTCVIYEYEIAEAQSEYERLRHAAKEAAIVQVENDIQRISNLCDSLRHSKLNEEILSYIFKFMY